MNPPGVAIFVQDVDALGGSEAQAMRLARALRSRGASVTLFSCVDDVAPVRWLGALWPEEVYGVRVHRLPRVACESLAAGLLRRRRERWDVIYGVGFMMGAIASRVGRLFAAPVVVKLACEGEWGDVSALEALPERVRREVMDDLAQATLVCPTAALEREARHAGFPPEVLTRIPNGIDIAEVRGVAPVRPPEAGDAPYVLFAGRLARQKGLDVLIEAMAGVPAPVKLLVAGEGPDATALKTEVLTDRLDERVVFLGRRDDVPGLMREASVCCLPSRAEGMSNTLLEALAAGTPVVASDLPGTREVVGEKGARLTEVGDADELAAALTAVLGDEAESRRLAAAGRKQVRAFDMNVVADAYLELFAGRHALRRRPGPARWAGRFALARGRDVARRLSRR